MKKEPLWTDQFQRPDDLPISMDLPRDVDVAIVGSGYTGLCAARVLRKSGASVAIFDRNTVGWGASSRNGGMATPGLKQDITEIYKKYGREKGQEFWKASIAAIDLIENIVTEENIDCDWSRVGHVALANKQSQYDGLEDYANWIYKEFGHKKKIITREELYTEIGTDIYFGGLADETSGGIHPAKYVYGLARAVGNQGTSILENTSVNKIEKNEKNFLVITSAGDLTAKQVIIATNGYTGKLVPQLKRRVIPVGSYIIATEPLAKELQDKLSPKKRMFYDLKWFINYYRLTPDGRMLWGGRNDLSIDLDLEESARLLSNQLTEVFPELQNVPITHTWSGRLGVTFDLMPHIGEIDGIYYANGYSGHGLSIATYLGTELGLLLTGEKKTSPFAEIVHQTMFFYRDKSWFLPIVSRYYRFLDWLP
jgi:glycine/D-amino acid oxidase-like deaminating enzyme